MACTNRRENTDSTVLHQAVWILRVCVWEKLCGSRSLSKNEIKILFLIAIIFYVAAGRLPTSSIFSLSLSLSLVTLLLYFHTFSLFSFFSLVSARSFMMTFAID